MDETPCYVEHNGEWFEGFVLRWWKNQDDEWRAYCEWTEGVGESHRSTVPRERVRPRGIGPNRARFSAN